MPSQELLVSQVSGKGPALFPQAVSSHAATPQNGLEQAVADLQSGKDTWARSTPEQKASVIGELLEILPKIAQDWVAASAAAKGLALGTPVEGEEWLTGPYITARNLRLLRRSLLEIARNGTPRLPGRPRANAAGHVVVPVFPTDLFDRLLFPFYSAEVWMQPDNPLSASESTPFRGAKGDDSGKICLVLGAGNVSSIPPTDAFYRLFVDNQVVLLKMNPVNDYLGSVFERLLDPFIWRNALRIVYGGASEGEFLCHHPAVDEIHITGSDKTHDAIVFGSGPEGTARKAKNEPLLPKLVTSELGNVSGVIVVPGKWTKADLRRQAVNLASMLVNNAGFNCNATRVIVTWKDWPQREALLNEIRSVLASIPTRKAYYPGAAERHARFVAAHPEAERFGDKETDDGDGHLPWTLISGLDPKPSDDICFTTEAFCSLMGETALAAPSPSAFVDAATTFVNDALWGTLNASILVAPSSLRDKQIGPAVQRAIANLRVGTVAINHWAGVSYALGCTTWGAFPGSEPSNIQSGRGIVHNTYLLGNVEKSVLYGRFRPLPKPVWWATHKNSHRVGPRLVSFECRPTWFKLPGIFWWALRG
jgi:acyl-CoA reductase-like NAD-dependent aldehyde dehydrogenase